mgnify:CR=1 FL=1
MFFNHKKYAEEIERHHQHNAQEKEPSFALMLTIGLMATFPPTRLFLHLHPHHVEDHSQKQLPLAQEKQIPILYLHGFRGGDYTTNAMIQQACQDKGTSAYLKVTADLWGNFKLEGTWTNDEHPIVQIVFKHKIAGTAAINYYLRFVLPFLRKRYRFTHYEAVAHSLGAPCLVKTELQTIKKKRFPHLSRCVLVAGPFDGVMYLGDIPNVNQLNEKGRPILMTPAYLGLLWRRHRLDSNLAILNIYGNILDETNTDRFISVTSAKSIRYLLAPKARLFQEIEIRGAAAEHSEMHDNLFVIGLIDKFLDLKK